MVLVAAAACVEDTPVNKAPVARIGSPANGASFDNGVNITFDGSGSYDPEKKALSFSWSFGDNATATGNKTVHAYALPGRYTVTLEVSDGKKKGTDRSELSITQANRAPVVRFSARNTTVSNEEQVELDASLTTDADQNDTLVFNWNFGDGTTGQGKVVSHLYPTVGSYNVTLNVSDGKTTAAAMQAITVYQANRAPVPVLKAVPLVAFINSPVEFDASGSTDADNDTLEAGWDFGDGANGTGLKTSHSYSRMGNFTATGTVRDRKAERTASIIVTVLPRAVITLDWNQTDYGYIVKTEQPVEKANLSVSVASSAGGTGAAAIKELAKDRYRATSTVLPSRGATLTVTAKYWGLVIGERTMTVYENMPMPGQNCTATFESSMSSHTTTDTSDEWFNVSGSVSVVVRDLLAEYSMRISNGSMENTETSENGDTRVGKSRITGWFNQTLDTGMQTATQMEMAMNGNFTTTNETGVEVERFTTSQEMVKMDHYMTDAYVSMKGTQHGTTLSYTVTTLGIEDHANGDGKLFSCIKLKNNYTFDAFMVDPTNPGGPMIHVMYFSEEVTWNVQDEDHYINNTIYRVFTTNMYNVTVEPWTLLQNSSGSEYPDSDDNGVYNPDPKPLNSEEAFTFHGLVPRELQVDDRITGTNEHDVTVAIEALEGGTRTVGGVTYKVILLKATFSGGDGRASGTSENWIVSEGNLTGLTLESKEQKRWAGEAGTEDSQSSIKAVRIEEE